jgi:hypothetical protein
MSDALSLRLAVSRLARALEGAESAQVRPGRPLYIYRWSDRVRTANDFPQHKQRLRDLLELGQRCPPDRPVRDWFTTGAAVQLCFAAYGDFGHLAPPADWPERTVAHALMAVDRGVTTVGGRGAQLRGLLDELLDHTWVEEGLTNFFGGWHRLVEAATGWTVGRAAGAGGGPDDASGLVGRIFHAPATIFRPAGSLLEDLANEASRIEELPVGPADGREGSAPRPSWNQERYELRTSQGKLARKFTRLAPSQMAILDALEAAGWPTDGVRSPLQEVEFTQRAVGGLNRGISRGLRFGRARGGRWVTWKEQPARSPSG